MTGTAISRTIKSRPPKQASEELQQVIKKIGSMFMTLEDSINEALELGRKEGFADREIGDMLRAEFKRINRPRITLSRYLPATAKHTEKSRPKASFGNILLPNPNLKPNEPASDSVTVTNLTEEAVVSKVQESEAEAEPAPSNTIVDIPGVVKFEPATVDTTPTTEEILQRYDIEQKERRESKLTK